MGNPNQKPHKSKCQYHRKLKRMAQTKTQAPHTYATQPWMIIPSYSPQAQTINKNRRPRQKKKMANLLNTGRKYRSINTNLLTANTNTPTNYNSTHSISTWRLILNHAPLCTFRTISAPDIFPTLTHLKLKPDDQLTFSACSSGNYRQSPYQTAQQTAEHHLQYIATDTIGPITQMPTGQHMETDTMGHITTMYKGQHRHFITFIYKYIKYSIPMPISSISLVQKFI